MTEKRFTEIVSTQKVIDNQTGREYYCLIDDELLDLLNELAEENKQLCNDCSILVQSNQEYRNENEQLKKFIMDLQNMIQFDVDNGIKTYPKTLSEYLANALKVMLND